MLAAHPATEALKAIRGRIEGIAFRFPERERDDLVSVGLVGAWRAWQAGERVERLLIGKAAWAMRDFLRVTQPGKRSRRVRLVSLEDMPRELAGGPPGDELLLALERQRKLDLAISLLPKRIAAAVRGVLAGERGKEIATRLGVTESRVSQMVHQATGMLARVVRDSDGIGETSASTGCTAPGHTPGTATAEA